MPTCTSCRLVKGSDEFYAHRNTCKICKIKQVRDNIRKSEHSFLRNLFSGCKMRHRRGAYPGQIIDWKSFKSCYYAQEGKCALSGSSFDITDTSYAPSPDRIHNHIGYVVGNIQFVTWQVNNMRSNLSIPVFVKISTMVANHSILLKHASPRVALFSFNAELDVPEDAFASESL